MRAILEILSGDQAGRRIVLESGSRVIVGRDSKADCSLPNDQMMSRAHFELETTAHGCRIRDLKSSNGTYVNGRAITRAELSGGERLAAGDTTFIVSFEATDMQPQNKLMRMLRVELQPLYAVLDAAADPDVLKMIHECKDEHVLLLGGPRAIQLSHFGPHLVQLSKSSALLEALIAKAWGKHWGIFLTCPGTPAELIAHLRRILTIETPDGRHLHFRFYDPRILRVFLPTCLPEQLDQFFGPIKCFAMEDKNPESLLRFVIGRGGMEGKSVWVGSG